MITVNDCGTVAFLGIAGEHDFREVEIDAGAWIARFPDCQITAVFQRPDGVAYCISLEQREGIVTWRPTESDTVPGLGALELRVHDGERLGKSAVIRTICAHSVDHPIDDSPPDDLPTGAEVGQVLTWSEDGAIWCEPMALSEEDLKALQNDVAQYVTQARSHMNRAEEYAGSAATSTSKAATSESNAAASASNASKSASSAENAKAAAETAQSAAETAQAVAETAANTAQDAAAVAVSARTDAQGFSQAAYDHLRIAVGMASNADTSASNAATSESNAAASASSVESAKADAETAKDAAETAKIKAESAQAAAASSATTAATAATEAKGYRDEVKDMLENAEVDPANAVLFTEQTLDEAKKTQARENIGALAKNQGTTNVGKILVVGADGNLTLTDMPSGTNGDVIGMIDANNNIVITGDLADGTYVFKYENTDGTYADIGNLVVGGVVEYAITASLTNCTGASSNATIIEENGTVTLVFTADDGYALTEIVTVSGATYTWDATTGALVLSNPTDDVAITVTATKSGYTNIIDTVGYEDDKRLSSTGVTKDQAGYVSTGMIDISAYADPVTIRTKGVNFNYDSLCYIVVYDASGTKLGYNDIPGSIDLGEGGYSGFVITVDDDGNIVITTRSTAGNYFRLSGYGSGANLIVTINEEIAD